VLRTAVALLIAFVLAGCEGWGREDQRGAVLPSDRVDEIRIGTTSQRELTEILGSPTATATFPSAGDVWYYISKETETVAFYLPKTLKQKVLEIQFDRSGRIIEMKQYGLDDAKPLEMVARTTPSRGKELSFTEQMFGNFGRFNSAQGTK
jgi:outer membrane protein assembly factor BamE (lipoprotein component of BamABCDE complex)